MNKPVDTSVATLTGAEAVVEMLKAHGVEVIFGLCGDTSLPFYDALARLPHGMRHVLTRDERHAAYMADGYARVSGRHGVIIGQNGPGISNAVTAIAAAYWAHSPVVIVTPETGTMGMGLGGFQEANQLPMFRNSPSTRAT